jgi:outer membrane protein OmpA-like peptidoglycan-associated protein
VALGILAAEIVDHPLISRYAGSVPSRRDDDGFRTYVLVTGLRPQGKTDEEIMQRLTVEGQVTRLAYQNPTGRSAHEIFTNYREALEAAGFEILFSCTETECGPGFASSRWGRVTGMQYFAPDMRYLSAKREKDGQAAYVAVLVAKARHQIEVVEATAMQRGLVTVQALSQAIETEGRAVLDGIFFDHDQAVLKPESKAALEVIAKFLAAEPGLRVYVVGHTDGSGSFEHNVTLSRERAQAVVDALIEDHSIGADRLAAHGVGPLAPAATNASEEGRGRNRRVELVAR